MLLFADDVSPKGLNRRHIASHIHKRESVAAEAAVQLCCRLWVGGYGVRPLCGRRVVGWCDPKLRSAYLGFSGVSPLCGFIAAEAAGYGL